MLLLLTLACGGSVEPAKASQDPVAPELKPDMLTHYDQVALARDALVRGDIQAYRNQLSQLSERLPLEGLPEAARPYEPPLASALLRAQASDSIPQGAERLAEVAATCGGCHKQMRAELPISETTPPPEEQVMQRHAWAIDQLWQGVIANDDQAMERGYMLLSETPLYSDLTEQPDPLVLELQLRVHDEAASMLRKESDREARAAAYGRMLGTCSQCHALTGGGPSKGQKEL